MLKQLLLGIAALLVTSTVCAQAYKWVDEDGVVHYSDRPHPGAERIQLSTSGRSSITARAPAPTARRAAPEPEPAPVEEQKPFSYEVLEVSSPAAEVTLWNIEGTLDVTLNLQPALQPGHRVRVYIDGDPRMVNGMSFQLDEVYRGIHNLQAEILDETGKLMIRSLPNRFYVQKNTIG